MLKAVPLRCLCWGASRQLCERKRKVCLGILQGAAWMHDHCFRLDGLLIHVTLLSLSSRILRSIKTSTKAITCYTYNFESFLFHVLVHIQCIVTSETVQILHKKVLRTAKDTNFLPITAIYDVMLMICFRLPLKCTMSPAASDFWFNLWLTGPLA